MTGLKAMIELEYSADAVKSLQLLSLRVPGDPSILQPAVSRLTSLAEGLLAELINPQEGIAMRLASGERLQALELHWSDPDLRADNRLRLTLSADFSSIDEALTALREDHARDDSDSLSARPFRRSAILADLDRWLGTALAAQHPEPVAPGNRTTLGTQADMVGAGLSDGGLAFLQPYCGACHAGDTLQPPGFLAGDDPRKRIGQCAPRILARLLAWQVVEDDAIAPMPPPATIHAAWTQSEHYDSLVDAVARLVGQSSQAAAVNARTARYEHLAPCLVSG
jgi:hypothetical protein